MGLDLNFGRKNSKQRPYMVGSKTQKPYIIRDNQDGMMKKIVKNTFSGIVSTILKWAAILLILYYFRDQILNFIITIIPKLL